MDEQTQEVLTNKNDKILICCDCKQEFKFTERDQEFFKVHGYVTPRRCKPCRIEKKKRFANRDNATGVYVGDRTV